MAAALLFVSSPCPLVRTTCMHPRPTRSRIPSQGHGMGGEAERRLHFRHGPPPPQGRGDAVSRVWALSRQVLPTGRRLAGRSRGLGPWPDPPPRPRTALLPESSARGHANPRLGETEAKEAPSPQRQRPPRSQSGGGPLASAEGALVIPKRRRSPSPRRRGPP